MYGLSFHQQIEALMDIEAYDEIVSRLNEEPELDQSDFKLHWSLGWSYYKLQQYEEAAQWLRRAVEIEPFQFAGYFALGVTLAELGELEEAEGNLRLSLRLKDSSVARQALAVVLMEKGAFAEAERVHLDGLQVKPNSADRWEGYADFLSDTGRETEADQARLSAQTLRDTADEDD
jgi:tetratricopeptide (TPR) repeat protein